MIAYKITSIASLLKINGIPLRYRCVGEFTVREFGY